MPLVAGSFAQSDAAERKLEAVVAGIEQRFGLAEPRPPEAPPESPRLGALAGSRLDEVKQHLIDLEYLEASEAEIAAEAPTPALRSALARFLEEAEGALDPALVAAARADEPEDPWIDAEAVAENGAPPSAVALELLRRATSIDGESALPSRPALGETGLAVRILHYQLKRIGLYHQGLADPVGGFTLNALRAFAAAFRAPGGDAGTPVSEAESLALIADVRLLIARLARELGRTPVLYRAPEGEDPVAFDEIRVREGAFETKGGFFSDIFGSGPSWDEDWPEFDSPEDRLQSLQNTMALRFLQIGLWALGFYARRLDGIWNADCHAALLAALESYDVEREEALRPVEGGVWALNVPLLVARVFGPGAIGDADFQRQLALLEQESAEPAEGDATAASEAERGFFERIAGGIRQALRSGARVLSGVKSLLKSAVDGLVRGVQWLAEGVQRLIGPVKNFFLFAYRGAREGVQMLVRSIRPFVHFVLRKPIVTNDDAGRVVAMTHFDLDRDAALWIAPRAPGPAVAAHAALCHRLARALGVVLRFLEAGIDLLIAALTGPLGWTRILVGALRKVVLPGWLALQSG